MLVTSVRAGSGLAWRSSRFSASLVVAFSFLSLIISGTSPVASASGLPIIVKVEGKAQMKKPKETTWVELRVGTEIPQGSRIQTEFGSRLQIKLENGSIVSLRENSIFEVLRSKDNVYDFRLWIGDVRSKVKKLGEGMSSTGQYTVRTPMAVAGVRGTDFLVSAAESGRTDVAVYEGSVSFRSTVTGDRTVVSANQTAHVSDEGDLSDVSTGVTADDEDDIAGTTGEATSTGTSTSAGTEDAPATAPLVISAPLNGAVVAGPALMVMGSATPNLPITVGGIATVVDASGRFATTIALVEGQNVVTVVAGREQSSITVTLDSIRPTISLGAYPSLTNVPSLTLGVMTKAGATVTAGGASVVAVGGQATLQLVLSEGENLITVRSADNQGLSSEQTIRVILDSIAPFLTISSMIPSASGVRAAGLTEPGATVSANGYPVELRTDGSFDQVLAGLSASEVTFQVTDAAGNVTRDVRNITGTVDGDPPSFLSLTFSPSSLEVGGSATIDMRVSDASGIAPSLSFSLTGPGGTVLRTTLSSSGSSYLGSVTVPSTSPGGSYVPSAVTLIDAIGNSASVSPSTSLLVTNTSPSAPSLSSPSDPGTGDALLLSWSVVSAPDLLDYILYQSFAAGSTGSPVYQGTGTSYSATGLSPQTHYYYVTARDIAGNVSVKSNEVSKMPLDSTAPSAPTITSVVGVSSSQISLAWTSSTGAVTYKIYQYDGLNYNFKQSSGSNSFSISGLSQSTNYCYKVSAVDNAPIPNESALSAQSCASTLAGPNG